jgi:hypothetical protein
MKLLTFTPIVTRNEPSLTLQAASGRDSVPIQAMFRDFEAGLAAVLIRVVQEPPFAAFAQLDPVPHIREITVSLDKFETTTLIAG